MHWIRSRNTALGRVLTVAVALAVGFGLTRLAEAGVGWYLSATRHNAGLIWGPYSYVEHTTNEFSYKVQVNNLGFRDRDFTVKPRHGVRRVLVLGDSFTYGWGVDGKQSWPKMLESELMREGLDVEVANLGSPGAGPRQYAELAERAIPLLMPELVIVGVLQADDLMQASDAPDEHRAQSRSGVLQVFREYYPNIVQFAAPHGAARLKVTQDELRGTWKHQVATFLTQMTPEERARYAILPNDARDAYLGGLLNPGLLYMALRHTRFLIDTCDASGKSRSGIESMGRELARIAVVASRMHARVLVLPVVYRAYASLGDTAEMRRLGFIVDDSMEGWTAPDEAIGVACRMAGVEMSTVTAAFRQQARTQALYFRMDGHLNIKGQATFGELVAPAVRMRLDKR